MTNFEQSRYSHQLGSTLFERNELNAPLGSGQPATFFPADSEIYAQGERCSNLYKVEFGAVRIYRLLSDGRRQISAFHMAGEMFGFEVDKNHHFFAEAICGTGIRILSPLASHVVAELLPMALQSLVRAQECLVVNMRSNASRLSFLRCQSVKVICAGLSFRCRGWTLRTISA